jgi:hypothetical protein
MKDRQREVYATSMPHMNELSETVALNKTQSFEDVR